MQYKQIRHGLCDFVWNTSGRYWFEDQEGDGKKELLFHHTLNNRVLFYPEGMRKKRIEFEVPEEVLYEYPTANYYKEQNRGEIILQTPTKSLNMAKKGSEIMIPDEKVMLDRDLAQLYHVETKVLKQAVRRNLDRFPNDFMFELSIEEFTILRSQFVTSSWGGARYVPMAFAEQGVAMLSSVLKSKQAIHVNIQIMRVFTRMREMLTDTLSLKLDIEEIKKKLENQDKNIELVFSYLDELIEKKDNPESRKRVGFKRKNEQ